MNTDVLHLYKIYYVNINGEISVTMLSMSAWVTIVLILAEAVLMQL
jgi:hypothetical protein